MLATGPTAPLWPLLPALLLATLTPLAPLPTAALSPQIRSKRDETEHSVGAYGRGIGFFVGEPCRDQCNAILFHIYCNKTTQRCECLPDYPVNIDNRVCVKAFRLGEHGCEYHESCKHNDINSVCVETRCILDRGSGKEIHSGRTVIGLVDYSHFVTIASAGAGLVAFAILVCAALRYFTKDRFLAAPDEPHRRYGEGPPGTPLTPPTIVPGLADHQSAACVFGSRRPSSIRSVSNEFLPPSRRASYSMLAPPSNIASRRPSSSAASQSSFRSYSSFRSQSSFRNYRNSFGRELMDRQRPVSSPGDARHSPPSPHLHPPMMAHHRHPLHTSTHLQPFVTSGTSCGVDRHESHEKCAIHSSLSGNPGA